MPGNYTFYAGSTVLAPLADQIGIRIDHINFVACQLVSIPASLFLYYVLSPKNTPPTVRLVFHLILGLSICLFSYGRATKHLLADSLICYVIMRWGPVRYIHRLVFLVAMGYMSLINFHRVCFISSNITDITGPLLILTQKLTSLAFSIHDGKVKTPEELTSIQKRGLVKETPDFLSFISYTFAFQGIACGPMCFYSDFIAFINGQHYVEMENMKNGNNNNNYSAVSVENRKDPSPWPAVIRKLTLALCLLAVNAFISPKFPTESFFDPHRGFFNKLWYSIVCMFFVRMKYYYGWVMDCH